MAVTAAGSVSAVIAATRRLSPEDRNAYGSDSLGWRRRWTAWTATTRRMPSLGAEGCSTRVSVWDRRRPSRRRATPDLVGSQQPRVTSCVALVLLTGRHPNRLRLAPITGKLARRPAQS